MREIYDAAAAGDIDRAREIDERLRRSMRCSDAPTRFRSRPVSRCSGSAPRARLPITEADDDQKAEVRQALEAQGLLTGSAA